MLSTFSRKVAITHPVLYVTKIPDGLFGGLHPANVILSSSLFITVLYKKGNSVAVHKKQW